MERYRKREKNKRIKKYFLGVFISSLILIICLLIYQIYLDIDVTNQEGFQNNNIVKTSQIIENNLAQNSNISTIIEEETKNIVGISKLKNVGNSIFNNKVSELGLGTGIVVTDNGYILTNEHVSGEKYSQCYVTLENGRTYTGNVVWSDYDIDLAIVKINAKNLPYATLGNSDLSRVGDVVYAIGNPIGFEFQRTVTSGIVSAKDRTIKIEEEDKKSYMEDLIQTDATINIGNSGGPLININGEVIGINSIKITSAEGIGFAIPINVIKPIVESFKTTGKFEEASLGIFAYDKNVIPYLDSELNLNTGIYVVEVNTNSVAERAGIKQKDVILNIDNIELNKMCDLRCYVYQKRPNDEVTLKILRNKKILEIRIRLQKK